MPLELLAADLDVFASPSAPTAFELPLRLTVTSSQPVTLLHVELAPALAGWVRLLSDLPLTLAPKHPPTALRFEALPGASAQISGTIELHVLDGELTAVREVPLSLWADHPFDGVFAVDLGGDRLAAAYIDPRAGSDQPRLLPLAQAETTYVAQFDEGAATPRRLPLEQYTRGPAVPPRSGAYFRPRRAMRRGGLRPAWPGGARLVEEGECLGWLLADAMRQAARAAGVGRPRQVVVPLPAGTTPGQLADFRRLVEQTPELRGRLRCALEPQRPRGLLDETSAVLFFWLWDRADELKELCRARGDHAEVHVLVLDAGSASVDLAVVKVGLRLHAGGRLEAAPQLLVRDGSRGLCGDRVTAALFGHLHRLTAEQVAPGERAEAAVPTRFRDEFGPEHLRRLRNFLALWGAAEGLKRHLDEGAVLPGCALPGLATVGPSDAAEVVRELGEDAESCLQRARHVLIANRQHDRFGIDVLLLAGGASQLPLFSRRVFDPLYRELRGGGREVALVNYGGRSKEVVACGAALAAFYRDRGPAAGAGAPGGRLVLAIDRFDLRLPFRLAALVGGAPLVLFERGAEFPLDAAGEPLPLTAPVALAYQPKLSLYRYPTFDLGANRGEYLGDVHLEGAEARGPVEVRLYPDLRVEAAVAGQVFPMTPAADAADDDPLRGLL